MFSWNQRSYSVRLPMKSACTSCLQLTVFSSIPSQVSRRKHLNIRIALRTKCNIFIYRNKLFLYTFLCSHFSMQSGPDWIAVSHCAKNMTRFWFFRGKVSQNVHCIRMNVLQFTVIHDIVAVQPLRALQIADRRGKVVDKRHRDFSFAQPVPDGHRFSRKY